MTAPHPDPPGPTTVAIVPHTHWDREWYEPFQAFRVRLVRLLDRLLDLLEHDLSYARFLLDGQTAVLDDYLEVRPEAAARLERLAASGRLQVGPWMILMDEFMVSGETMIRDLQLGIARATALGGAMQVGYLPDMFGHVAQMPQLLRLAGLDHAVVWRGVPAAVTQTAFWWEAPDGSRVRAESLYGSYSNGRDLPDDAKALVARARGYEAELGGAKLSGGGMLLMNGTDHQLPQPWLGRVVAEANEVQDDYRFVVTSLAEYLPSQPTSELITWSGELRSGARANVLMGVASNRVDVHRACAAAERSIERVAEPLSALLLPPSEYPAALLDVAWRNLVLNSAHDSSCACSADDVVDAVVVRYQEARHVGDALSADVLSRLAAEVDAVAGSVLVVNPTGTDRGGVVTVTVPGKGPVHFVDDEGASCRIQVVATTGGEGFSTVVTGQKVRWVLEMMRGPQLAGVNITRVDRRELALDDWEFSFVAADPGDPVLDLEETREELLALGEKGATIRFHLALTPSRELLIQTTPVAGFGWRTLRAVEGTGRARPVERETTPSRAASAGDTSLTNEHLTVTVAPDDGTLTIRTSDGLEIAGLDRLVDGGDGGGTYSYSPPTDDVIVDRPSSVRVTTTETGPVRARLLVERTYDVPVAAIGNEFTCTARSAERVSIDVATTLELRAGERFVRVHTEIDNRARDHRLRAHFPLPAAVDHSDAECAFAVVQRGLTAEGGPHEVALPTFVSRRFVDCSGGEDGAATGLALLHDGLLEYEVVGDGSELALTLLRATGYLSRAEPGLRPNPAGPLDPLTGPQLQGVQIADYAILPHRGDWRSADLYAAADELLVPLEHVRTDGTAAAQRAPSGRALQVEGAQVSAVTRDAGDLVVRVFNPSPDPAVVQVAHAEVPAAGWIVDLVGRPCRPFEGTVDLGPWEIVTLRLHHRSK